MGMFFILPLLFWAAILGGGFYLAFRLIRAYELRSSGGGGEIADLRNRLERLEDGMESMNKRVETIGEAQDFTTKLLTDKSPGEPDAE